MLTRGSLNTPAKSFKTNESSVLKPRTPSPVSRQYKRAYESRSPGKSSVSSRSVSQNSSSSSKSSVSQQFRPRSRSGRNSEHKYVLILHWYYREFI